MIVFLMTIKHIYTQNALLSLLNAFNVNYNGEKKKKRKKILYIYKLLLLITAVFNWHENEAEKYQ